MFFDILREDYHEQHPGVRQSACRRYCQSIFVMEAPPHANTDEQYMRAALVEAVVAREEGDVPIGAVVVRGTKIIGRGHNQRELLRDPTAHAEMIALTAAAAEVGSWRLDECTLYVILEPCTMCAGAIVLARLKRLVFGAIDPKAGACGSLYNIPTDSRLNHSVEITQGVLAAECSALLSDFFAKKRAQGKG